MSRKQLNSFILSAIFLASALFCRAAGATNQLDQFTLDEIVRGNGIESLEIDFLDSLVFGNSVSLDTDDKINLLKRQMEAYMSVGAYGKAAHTYELINEVDKGYADKQNNLKSQLNYGNTLLYTGRYLEAYSIAFSVLPKTIIAGNFALKADALLLLANISIRTGDLNQAQEYLSQTKDALSKLDGNPNKQVLQFRYYLGLSSLEISKKDYTKAYDYIKQAEKTSVEPDSMPYTLNMNIAIIYDFLNDPKDAERYYQKITESPRAHYNKCVAMNNYAFFLIRQHRPEEAVEILNKNIPDLKSMGSDHALAQAYTLLYNAYVALADYQSASQAADSAMSILTQLMNDHYKMQYDQIACIHENKQLREDLSTLALQMNTILIVAFLIQIFLGFIFCAAIYMIKRRRKQTFTTFEQLLNLKYKHILEDIRLVSLEEVINQKNRQLVACKLKINQYEETLNDLPKHDKNVSQSEQQALSAVVEKLKSLNHSKSNWEAMRLYFEEIYPGFYTLLEQKHPNLTRGEKRMSAFIISGMNTSEIADLCNRSPRTIESIKYQMKKKLGLTPEDSLEKYLNSFRSI